MHEGNGKKSDWFEYKWGLIHGCVILLLLFHMFIDYVLKEARLVFGRKKK